MSNFSGRAWKLATGIPRAAIIVGVVLAAVSIFLWFAVPIWTVNYMNERLDTLPDYRGHIDHVGINIWDASMDTYRVKLVKKNGEVPLPFFVSPQIHISLQWSEIFNGTFRSFITIYEPVINAVAGKSDSSSQFSTSRQLVDELKQLVPFKINRLDVVNGDVHFYDRRESPPVELEMDQIQVSAENLTNSQELTSHYPSTVQITGRPLCKGKLNIDVKTNLAIKEPTFVQKVSVEAVPASALNSALSKYIRLRASSGTIDLFSEIRSEHGRFVGYVKPFFENLNFDSTQEDRDSPLELWSDFANLIKHAFESDQQIVATRVDLSGDFEDPQTDLFAAFLGVLNNAWFEALKKGLDPLTPAQLEAARRFEPEAAEKSAKPGSLTQYKENPLPPADNSKASTKGKMH